jgi:hypothetical protein
MKVTKLEKTLLSLALSAAFIPNAAMADYQVQGAMPFDPIPGSAYGHEADLDLNATPWIVPEGYSQSIVSDESDLNIYAAADWNDMNTVNETRKFAGRYLYRTHEVRGANSARAYPNLYGETSGGAVSVVDLQTGEAQEIVGRADWEALDGLVWTPWHTVLFAEEVITASLPDPDAPQATSGLVYELKLKNGDPTAMDSVTVRPKLGSLSHEGMEIDEAGNVYVIDEDRKGSIYKFVPAAYGNLAEGRLYALKVDEGKTGSAQWVALDMDQAQISARVAATAVGATQFCRPEDMERIAKTLYVALTCEDVDNAANTSGPGAVLAVTLSETPSVRYAVAAGKNAPVENQAAGVTGFKGVDNLANGPDGKLWMVEDNAFSDIWVYDPASADGNGDGYRDGVYLFASLKDKPAEGTGIYFGKDPQTLFVNVQHSGTGNDKTMAITRNAE